MNRSKHDRVLSATAELIVAIADHTQPDRQEGKMS